MKKKIYPKKNLNSYIQSQTTRKLPLFHGNLPITKMHRGTERTSYIPFLLNPKTRLDVIPVRLHFRETIPQARQPISHQKVCVNNFLVQFDFFYYSARWNPLVNILFSILCLILWGDSFVEIAECAGGGSGEGEFLDLFSKGRGPLPVIEGPQEFVEAESIIPPPPTGASSSQPIILSGVPVEWSDTVTYTSPHFMAASVYLPGEVDDPLTIERLSNLNQLLVNIRVDHHGGVMQPGYIRSLQQEVSGVPPSALPDLLEKIFIRERVTFYPGGELLPFICVKTNKPYLG